MKNLEFYALAYDFNKQELVKINIFNSVSFLDKVQESITQYNVDKSLEHFKQNINAGLKYTFWSRREYELSVGDAFETDLSKYEKIDVYQQVFPNLNILVKYIIDNI